MFVSVVIPAYNAQDTIEFTLKDIIAQSYSEFEVVVVDDGSTDNTKDICDAYALKDKRIRVVHQKNQGVSVARNKGIFEAAGDYISFVDSDDRIERYYLEYLVRALIDSNADMVCAKWDRVKEGTNPNGSMNDFKYVIYDKKEALGEMLVSKKISVGPWNRLVPREWYLKYPFLVGKRYEDLSNTYKLHLEANSVAYVDAVLYHYVMRGGSITGRKNISIAQCLEYYEAINLCLNDVIKVFPDLDNDVAVLVARDYLSLYLSIHRCINYPNKELLAIENALITWMKKNGKKAVKNKKAPVTVRMRVFLFLIGPKIYSFFYYIGAPLKGKAIA